MRENRTEFKPIKLLKYENFFGLINFQTVDGSDDALKSILQPLKIRWYEYFCIWSLILLNTRFIKHWKIFTYF